MAPLAHRAPLVALCLFTLLLSATTNALAVEVQGPGIYGVHDPSRIIKCGRRYYLYSTGANVPMHYSDDLIHWSRGQAVLSAAGQSNGVPAWARQAVPGNTGSGIWAPDVLYFHGLYHLYYAFADWNSNNAVIALATSPTLDPSAPNYHWTDQGKIIGSDAMTTYNTIDPCPVFDQAGNLWLSFGSMGKGPRLISLDKKTGLRSTSNTTMYQFAQNRGEATYIYFHRDYYYFFKNRGSCCKGTGSTYHILMGRAKTITGPYFDKDGINLTTSEGTMFLQTDGDKIGPGQIGIYSEGGTDYYSFHYYNGARNGLPTLGLGTLVWGADGWPAAGRDPTSAPRKTTLQEKQ